MVSINPALAISVATTGQNLNFETRLNAMKNTFFKLESTLEKFLSAKSFSHKSRGEKYRGYLADFSVNASQSEIDHSSRSSHQICSLKNGVLRNFAKFTGKHLCQSLFFNKVADLRPETLLKKRLWHRCFSVKIAKYLRVTFLQNTSV